MNNKDHEDNEESVDEVNMNDNELDENEVTDCEEAAQNEKPLEEVKEKESVIMLALHTLRSVTIE